MVAPVLTDLSFQYTDAGYVLNVDASTPPFVDVSKIAGLDSSTVRTSTRDTEGMDGGIVEADFESVRTIIIEGTLYGTTETLLDTIKSNYAVNPTAQPFYFKMPGVSQRVVFAKCITGFRYDVDLARRLSMTNFQVQLQASDPVIYSSAVSTAVVSVAAALTSGRGYSRLYPLSYGGPVSSGVFSISNNGNRPVGATFVITGPVTNPIITSDTQAKFIQVLISLSVTDTLTIDLLSRSILLNGTTNRRNLMTSLSRWFTIQPGVNQLRFNASSATASQLTVTWRDGWR